MAARHQPGSPSSRTRQVRRLTPLQQGPGPPQAVRSTRAAAERFFHNNGVRGMLHDIASELALLQPEDPRKYLYEKLRLEFVQQDAEQQDAIEEPCFQTDCLRVHIECRAGERVRRDMFVRRAPPTLPSIRGAAGVPADSGARLASWRTEALAAVTSVVHEAAGLEPATQPEMTGAASNSAPPGRSAHDEGAQAQLNDAEEAILSFWLLRGGGGAGGDAALAADFFEGRDEALDAKELCARLHKVLGVKLDPAHSAQLLARLLSASARGVSAVLSGGAAKLSPEALRSWVHFAYPLFELEQMLLSEKVQLHKIAAHHLVRRGNGQDVALTRDEVRESLLAAASDMVDRVYGQIVQVAEARMAAKTGAANGKFAGDDLGGTFEGKFASAQAFHGGLDRHLGLPDPKVLDSIINEHRNAPNADTPYTTTNYGLTCTPREELVRAQKVPLCA